MTADPLFDADLAHTDTFWADMRRKTSVLLADLLTLESDMDELSLELTRVGMRRDGAL